MPRQLTVVKSQNDATLVVVGLDDTQAHHLGVFVFERRWCGQVVLHESVAGGRVASGTPETLCALDAHAGGALDGRQAALDPLAHVFDLFGMLFLVVVVLELGLGARVDGPPGLGSLDALSLSKGVGVEDAGALWGGTGRRKVAGWFSGDAQFVAVHVEAGRWLAPHGRLSGAREGLRLGSLTVSRLWWL